MNPVGEVESNFGRTGACKCFCGAEAILGGCPSKDVVLVIRNWAHRGDGLDCLIVKSVKSVRQKLHIPCMTEC